MTLFHFNGEQPAWKISCWTCAFMCMLLTFMKGLDLEDKEILIEAALYHDTGRCSDAEDNTHGAESAKMLQEAYPDTEPITLFLMEYHCRPDEEGYEFIKEHWTDKQDALRVKTFRHLQGC